MEPIIIQPESKLDRIKNFVFRFKFLIILLAAVIISGSGIYLFISKDNYYQKPKAWVISQSLYQTIAKNQLLAGKAKGGVVSLDDVIGVATASVTPKSEVLKTDEGYLITTGFNGEAVAEIPKGTYKVKIVPIPGIDFVGVPSEFRLNKGIEEFRLFLTEGSGRILQDPSSKTYDPKLYPKFSEEAKLVIHLYHDKNSNGKKDKGEERLNWAGITVQLTNQYK